MSSAHVGHFDGSPAEWDQFVAQHPDATVYHRYAWPQIVTQVYDGVPYYLAAHRDDRVTGVLPLMCRRLIGRGRVLISVPFADEGGICAASRDAEALLLQGARALGHEVGADSVELRQLGRPVSDAFPCDASRVVLRMPLPAQVDELRANLSKNMRKKLRRASRDGLVAREVGPQGLRGFYDVYARNMRDLGSPMHSRRFFEAALTAFPESSLVVHVEFEGQVVGGGVALWLGEVLTVLCAHSLRKFNRLFPNNLLYWQLLTSAIERGCNTADFGRSPPGTGIYDFKKLWGMEDHPLYYTLIPIRSSPTLRERREGMAYRIFSSIWRRMPMPLARTIGPRVFSRIPI